jgi:predicted nucleic acid-binding protein
MNDRVLLDTNILVYLYDIAEKSKRERALTVVDDLIRTTRAVISPQVMGEFFQAVTRSRRPLLTHEEALARIRQYLIACEVVPITELIVLEATRGVESYQFSYWDAQIWATARLNQITTVYSEDFNSGATIEGINFVNPLNDGGRLSFG